MIRRPKKAKFSRMSGNVSEHSEANHLEVPDQGWGYLPMPVKPFPFDGIGNLPPSSGCPLIATPPGTPLGTPLPGGLVPGISKSGLFCTKTSLSRAPPGPTTGFLIVEVDGGGIDLISPPPGFHLGLIPR